jgi:L-ascorbate metabolism protein UlaG (beta-lactamase superfamily)
VTRSGGEPAVPFPDEADAFPWPDGGSLAGTFRWTGTSGFRLDVGHASIAFDPFVTRPGLLRTFFRRPRIDDALVADRFSDLDAAFVGHTHYDHAMDLPAVARASPHARIHGSPTTVELCRRLGVGGGRLVAVADRDRLEVGPFAVEVVASDHGVVPIFGCFDRIELKGGGVPGTPFRYPRGAVFAWRVEVGGRSLHVQGSAGIDDAALERQPPVDVLLACLAARQRTTDYLKRLGARLRPKVLVPLHHDNFYRPLSKPPKPVLCLRWKSFLRDARELEAEHGTVLWRPPFDRTVRL